MSSDPQQFALKVLEGFKNAGHHTDQEIGDAGGPSTTTMTKLRKVAEEGGNLIALRGDTLRKIDRAAEWMPGSARSLWTSGAEPKASTSGSRMREILGQPPLTPEQVREARRTRNDGTFEGYVEGLADRILEVEERLDELEQELRRRVDPRFGLVMKRRLSAPSDTTEFSVEAAHDEVEPIERGQGHDENA